MDKTISKEHILSVLTRHVYEVIPELQGRSIGGGDSLRELGANSMDRADIVMEVMEALALKIPRAELLGPRNIGELVDLIHAKL